MNSTPLLTIGMAQYADFDGVFFSIQALRLNDADLMSQVEFVVIDNSPHEQATASALKGLLGVHDDKNDAVKLDYTRGVRGRLPDCAGTVYCALPENSGTSISRQKIFDVATGKYVLVMDCHVLLWPGALQKLVDYYAAMPETNDLLSGPLIYDSLRNISTHFDDQWNAGMWGTWGQAWQCLCGPEGVRFSMTETKGDGRTTTTPRLLQMGCAPVDHCPACGKPIPTFPWEGHERQYTQLGFFPLGFNGDEAFEIPGQGLGLFSCRREAWLGFNPHARGFGGEELYIHEKYRQAGHKALCLPALKWNHRFYRSGGVKYKATDYLKVRNYVLEFTELGMDLTPIHDHFVGTGKNQISEEVWEILISDPIRHVDDPVVLLEQLKKAETILPAYTSIDLLFAGAEAITRDLNEHMTALRALTATIASREDSRVVEFTGRKESTIAFLAGRPRTVTSYSTEAEDHVFKSSILVRDTTRYDARRYTMGDLVADLPENDLCFIDTFHRAAQLASELNAYHEKCRRYIVIHDTEIYGLRGDDGGLGLVHAISEFVDDHPQWAVVDHTKEQYGLTVLSCDPDDRPETPIAGFAVPHGPGTELKKILASLGIHPAPDCGCNAKANQMDVWGIEGCEKNFETIVKWLKEGTWKGLDLVSAASHAFFTGIAFQISPLRPFESLVALCLKRARDTEAKRQTRKAA